jgi:hypothetical protein
MRRAFLSITLAALLALPATAETDWAKYTSFASTRCEDAATIADILESLKGLTFNDSGRPTFGNASNVKVIQSRTVRATSDTLVCQLRMQTFEGGVTQNYNSRHTVKLFSGGRWTTHFNPNY